MSNHNYGAHEVIELQDVLTNTINSINTFQLYLQSVQDASLRTIALNQLRFMQEEYNQIVHFVHGLAPGHTFSYRSMGDWTSEVDVNQGNLTNVQPATQPKRMTDHDIASCMLTLHKASATMRMHAALECADQQIRQIIQQGANNCAHQAYEVWGYLHSHGGYPVPSLDELSQTHVLHGFQPSPVRDQTIHAHQESAKSSAETPYSESVYSSGFETGNLEDANDASFS